MIAVIQATFNHEITDLLTTGCLNQLKATETQYEYFNARALLSWLVIQKN